MLIENLVLQKSISYMDAIIHHCDVTGLEVEVAAKLISGPLKSKLKLEAQELNFLPKSNTKKLPL